MIRLAIVALALAIAAPAHADPQTSKTLFAAGKRKYELGEYDQAIELFKMAYKEHPFPAYFYNIGQAFRKSGDCKSALDFFGRFLDSDPTGPARERVEADIAEVSKTCDTEPESQPEPEPEVKTPEPEPEPEPEARVADARTAEPTGPSVTLPAPAPSGPSLFAATAEVGVTLFDIGDVIVPVSPTLRLFGGYPLELAGVRVEPGLSLELQTMAYEHAMGDSTAMFTTVLVGGQAHYPIADKIAAGADLGFGIMRFSSLEAGNPFVEAGAERTGTETSFALRLGLSGEYALLPGLSAAFTPAFVWASRTDDLREPISSFTRIELLAGVRYRR